MLQAEYPKCFVEGGAKLLQGFVDENLYDEIRIITNENMIIGDGLSAPVFSNHELELVQEFALENDKIRILNILFPIINIMLSSSHRALKEEKIKATLLL